MERPGLVWYSGAVTWQRKAIRLGATAVSIAIVPLPSSLKIPLYRAWFGYRIGRRVRIGWSWIRVDRLAMGDGSRIGHLNRIKDIPDVHLGEYAVIGHQNTFVGSIEFTHPDSLRTRGNTPKLVLGPHSSVTMQHYFDVNDACEVGAFTVVAGVGSIFFTHYLDITTSTQAVRPIHIGPYCMLGAGVRMVPGAAVAEGTVVGMGAVVTKAFVEKHVFIAGSPAAVIRTLSPDAPFFHRTQGWIGSYATPPVDHAAR